MADAAVFCCCGTCLGQHLSYIPSLPFFWAKNAYDSRQVPSAERRSCLYPHVVTPYLLRHLGMQRCACLCKWKSSFTFQCFSATQACHGLFWICQIMYHNLFHPLFKQVSVCPVWDWIQKCCNTCVAPGGGKTILKIQKKKILRLTIQSPY